MAKATDSDCIDPRTSCLQWAALEACWPLYGLQGQHLGRVRRIAFDSQGIRYFEVSTAWQRLAINADRIIVDDTRKTFQLRPPAGTVTSLSTPRRQSSMP